MFSEFYNWSLINEVVNKAETEDFFPQHFIIDGQLVNDKNDTFFTNVGNKLANYITVPPEHNFKEYLHSESDVSFSVEFGSH